MDEQSIFLQIDKEQYLLESAFFFVIRDKFPVSPGHSLIISKMHRIDYFDLTNEEKHDLIEVIDQTKFLVDKELNPDGYNVGINNGQAAGQTVFHFHCHLIPRFKGDMDDPKGGVRHCISGRGYIF
jgi:diadenosine tetraphosphate (Ap4A) HIT family hydrolase